MFNFFFLCICIFVFNVHTVIGDGVHPSQVRLLYRQRGLFRALLREFRVSAYDSHVFAVGNAEKIVLFKQRQTVWYLKAQEF